VLGDQMAAALALLGSPPAEARAPIRWARTGAAVAAAAALGVDGICAGMGTGPAGAVLVWDGQRTSAALESAQLTLGHGPSKDVLAGGVAALVPDLARETARWPAFTPVAADLGVCAMFAFPLRIGEINLGVLTAHRASIGPLCPQQVADAIVLADAVTVLMPHQVSQDVDDPDPGADGSRRGWERPIIHRAAVHQATEMISVQLGIPLREALVPLRAHACGNDRRLDQVAANARGRTHPFGLVHPARTADIRTAEGPP
jgi:hypothetical protein